MDMLVVQGGRPLSGRIRVDGSKNAALPIMAAALAIPHPVHLAEVPRLVDVRTMRALLQSLGALVTEDGENRITIDSRAANGCVAGYELVRQMRASICVLGPLLARFGRARVSLPGGCNIGHRPVDLHLKGLAALGANLCIENGYISADCDRLTGNEICLSGPYGSTVTGTCNVMVAASLAEGRTVIRSAACEPEVIDLGRFLNTAGANIQGLGTSNIEILGVDRLTEVTHQIVPDRIEAATLAIAAAATRGCITISNAPVEDLTAIVETLQKIGVTVTHSTDGLKVDGTCSMQPIKFCAEPFPGIPTDCQAQLMALLCTVEGKSSITDRVFPDRFMHAAELMRMGAQIVRHPGQATIEGGNSLTAANVMASDLRASAALIIAALTADGISCVRRIYHLDRGYVRLEDKLTALGAAIKRQSERDLRQPHFLSKSNSPATPKENT